MKIKYNLQSQDVNIFISRDELFNITYRSRRKNDKIARDLLDKIDSSFPDCCIKATNKDAKAHFYLGSSALIPDPFMQANIKNLYEENKIQLIHTQYEGDPYYINLLPEAAANLEKDGQIGLRMLGGSKLTIALEEAVV